MGVLFTNNASALLTVAINSTDTVVRITPSESAEFPAPAAGGADWFAVTLVDAAGNLEIMRCEARSGDTLDVVRGQEGSLARAFPVGSRVDHRLTAAALAAIASVSTVTWGAVTEKPDVFPPELPIPQSGVTGLDAGQAAQDAAISSKLPSAVYTAEDVMAKVLSLDGTGSALDADKLDGADGAHYLDYGNFTNIPAAFPPQSHQHSQGDVFNLTEDLASKAGLVSPVFTGDPRAPTPTSADNDTSIATTAFVHTNLNFYYKSIEVDQLLVSYAPLASPIFTGNPTAPTPAAGDNDTSIATTAFVTAALGLKANLASPAFTGNPTAPTASAADNDTSIATTAFVKTAIAGAAAATFIGDVPPVAPTPGQLWWESDTGNMYIYYNDGNSSQWVSSNVAAGVQGPPGSGGGSSDWADITNKPATFAPTLPIAQSGITNLVTDLAGKAASVHTHTYASLTSIPSTFAPSAHVHTTAEVTGLDTALSGKAAAVHTHAQGDVVGLSTALSGKSDVGHSHSYASLTSIPSTFAPSAHSHPQSEVTNLVADLAAKASAVHTHVQADISGLVTDLAGKAAAVHTHAQADISGLVTDLAGKAAAVHTHAQADITGLVTALAGKSDTSHTHSYASLTGIPSTFTPSAHSHAQSEVTNLVTDLAAKASTTYVDARTPKITVSATAPTSPATGDVWIDTT